MGLNCRAKIKALLKTRIITKENHKYVFCIRIYLWFPPFSDQSYFHLFFPPGKLTFSFSDAIFFWSGNPFSWVFLIRKSSVSGARNFMPAIENLLIRWSYYYKSNCVSSPPFLRVSHLDRTFRINSIWKIVLKFWQLLCFVS